MIANALYCQRVSADAECILSFETISQEMELQECGTNLTVKVNDPVIHAFETPSNDILVGTRPELKPQLAPLVEDSALIDLPSLRLDVIEFCDLDSMISDAAGRVYKFLHSISSYSAIYWRDQTFLAGRLRRKLQKYLYSRNRVLIDAELLDGLALSIINKRPVLSCSAELYANLKPLLEWDAWVENVKEEMRFHLAAFEAKSQQLRIVVDHRAADESDASETPASQVAAGIGPGRWVIATFGQTATVAARDAHRRGLAVASVDCGPSWNKDVAGALTRAERRSKEAGKEAAPLLILCTSREDSINAAASFVKAAPRHVRLYAVILYRTRDGIPSKEPTEKLLLSDRLEGVTVIPDNDFPIGESHTKTGNGTVVASFVGALDRFNEEGKQLPRGRSLYSMGWTRFGVRSYEEALTRSIAAIANPWVLASSARSATVFLSSVGRPSNEFASEVGRQVNQTLFPSSGKPFKVSKDSIRVAGHWIQRRFMPGGNIPAKIELLMTGIPRRSRSSEEALSESARTIVSAAGYRVRDGREGGFYIVGKNAKPLFVSVAGIASRVPTGPDSYIQLMPNNEIQQAVLKQYDESKSAIPLLVGDLFYLNHVQDPKWTAILLASLARPKRLWPTVLRTFIQESLQRELARNDRYRNFWKRSLPKSAAITSTSIVIANTERRAGRQAIITGIMSVAFKSPGARRKLSGEGSKDAKFVIKVGPAEFSLLEFDIAA